MKDEPLRKEGFWCRLKGKGEELIRGVKRSKRDQPYATDRAAIQFQVKCLEIQKQLKRNVCDRD